MRAPSSTEARVRFKYHELLVGTLLQQMVRSPNAGDSGAHDEDVKMFDQLIWCRISNRCISHCHSPADSRPLIEVDAETSSIKLLNGKRRAGALFLRRRRSTVVVRPSQRDPDGSKDRPCS